MADLVASIKLGDLDLTSYPYAWEFGGDLGKPALVTQALAQQLQDGEVVSANRSSNREIVLSVLVEAADLAAQADAESALALECAKARNTLTYNPGDGVAAPTVFDTFVAEMALDRDDDMERSGLRRWKLTIPALPFARSDGLVTVSVQAAPASVVDTVVDSGSSTTGWTAAPSSGNAVQTFVSSTTWTAPTGVTSVTVEAEGGGGGGSGLTSLGSGGGGGGGGGAYASSVVAVTPGTGYAIVVGAGGAKGATLTNSNAGSAGGASSFGGSTVKAAGGSGAPAHTEPSAGAGGAGGTVANSIGTTRTAGSNGGGGYTSNGGYNINGGAGGNGAPPLGGASSTTGRGGTGDGDYTNAQAGYAGSVKLTYVGAWAVSTNGSMLQVSKPPYGNTTSYAERTGLSQSLATLPYIKAITSWTGTGTVTGVLVNGAPATILAQSGGTYYIDGTGLGTLTSIRFELSSTGTAAATFSIDAISVTNSVTGGSTGRQNARQVPVLGSARAIGSLSVEDSANALGSTLVYSTSATDSSQPPLRPYLVAGPTVTADSTTTSGSTSDLGTQHWFDLPANGVSQAGYLLLARVKHASAGDRVITWSARSRMAGADVGSVQTDTRTVTLTAGTWAIASVALLNLPVTRVGSGGYVRIGLSGPAGLLLDDAWLMDLDHGRLTWVECGATSKRLWLDTASVDDPVPSLWRGVAADRSDAQHAGIDAAAWGVHELVPPVINVFTVTTGSTAATLNLSYFPRWHTHVGSAS